MLTPKKPGPGPVPDPTCDPEEIKQLIKKIKNKEIELNNLIINKKKYLNELDHLKLITNTEISDLEKNKKN